MAAAALIASALLPLGLGAGMSLTYDTSVRLESRVRQVRPETGAPTTNEAYEVQPTLGLDGAISSGSIPSEKRVPPALATR